MLESLGNVWGLLLAVVGFGAIIFIHELGHFVAARWAGIRVYAFAVGFGPAALAWRKGIGLKRGSTNGETLRRLREHAGEGKQPEALDRADHVWPDGLGKTEYRLNWLPLGGYVQMRGQDDVSPSKGEADRGVGDSFVDKPVWKRMVVISAGVVMNVILALVLYIAVYTMGKPASPAVIGGVRADSPAAQAVAINVESAGVSEPGLRNGDEVLLINGNEPREFADVWLEGALASGDEGVSMTVRRAGVSEPLQFRMETERIEGAEFRGVGVFPARSTRLAKPGKSEADRVSFADALERAGVDPDAERVLSINGQDVSILPELSGVFDGRDIPYTYEVDGEVRSGTLRGVPELQETTVRLGERPVGVRHAAGFVPPLATSTVTRGAEFGLRPGDVFTRIGRVEWPGPAAGIKAITEAAGTDLEIVVLREGERVRLTASVTSEGSIGFYTTQALDECVVTRPLAGSPAERVDLAPGTVIETVNGSVISGYAELRDAMASATADTPIELGVRLPLGEEARTTASLTLTQGEINELRGLGWSAPTAFGQFFKPAEITLKASNPIEAIVMGVNDTNQMILRTYLTLVRLVEGTVEVNQLRGPVGIAHIGTQVAQRSLPELLFFFAVISANLAVLNFLPIPIADGGMMVFLILEAITGKPVSPAVQNAAALVGLALLGSVFLLVTFNDLTRLL